MMSEIDTAIWVQILDEADCLLNSDNTLVKGVNLIILSLSIGK